LAHVFARLGAVVHALLLRRIVLAIV